MLVRISVKFTAERMSDVELKYALINAVRTANIAMKNLGMNGLERAETDFSKAQVMTCLTEQGMMIAKELEMTMIQEVIYSSVHDRFYFHDIM